MLVVPVHYTDNKRALRLFFRRDNSSAVNGGYAGDVVGVLRVHLAENHQKQNENADFFHHGLYNSINSLTSLKVSRMGSMARNSV